MSMETPFRIEPCRLDQPPERIADIVAEIAAASATLGRALHSRTAASLADLVRLMNCYYSNLIEGHGKMGNQIASPTDADRHSKFVGGFGI